MDNIIICAQDAYLALHPQSKKPVGVNRPGEGKSKELTVGSLDYVRDWSYARDTVQAILLIIQKGVSGSYVISSCAHNHKFIIVI